MTAFLFIPNDGGHVRRVDFSNIASLFSEAEELPPGKRSRHVLNFLAAVLLVLLALGDTVLVNRPDALTSMGPASRPSFTGAGRAASF